MILAPFPTQASKLLLLASIEAILTEHWGNDAPPAPGEANTLFPSSLTLASAPPPLPSYNIGGRAGLGAPGWGIISPAAPKFSPGPKSVQYYKGEVGGGLMWCCL